MLKLFQSRTLATAIGPKAFAASLLTAATLAAVPAATDALAAEPLTAFVAGTGLLIPVDTQTPIRIGDGATGHHTEGNAVAITPDGTTALVTHNAAGYLNDKVTRVDLVTRTVTATISQFTDPNPRPDLPDEPATTEPFSNPVAIAITPDGQTAYVARIGQGPPEPGGNALQGGVERIDLATNLATSVDGANDPARGIAIGAGGTPYVVHGPGPIDADGDVTPIDVAGNRMLSAASIAVGDHPWGIAITPDGHSAFVANIGSDDVTPIDLTAGTALPNIDVGNEPKGVAITPDGTTAYVTNVADDNVAAIDILQPDEDVVHIDVGDFPQGIAITPDGTTAYVANKDSDDVTAINTSTNSTSTFDGFTAPTGIAFGRGLPPVVTDPPVTPPTAPPAAPPNVPPGQPTVPSGPFGSAPRGTCDGRTATIEGTEDDDKLVGTNGDDVIVALGGDDRIDGRGGNDIICAGDGNDKVKGGSGDDRLFGERGNDKLDGGSGKDRIRGDAGADRIKGGKHDDRLKGGAGDDALYGNQGDDLLQGGPGRDRLRGGPGTNRLEPGPEPRR
jgi:YVTN family beta-propeller protein